MNKNGFTLIELLITMVVMSLIMMIVYPSFTKLLKNNDTKKYQTYEDMMVEYARVSDSTSNIIRLNELKELDEVKKNCTGYVTVDRENNNYKAYIKCGNKYTTVGFSNDI